MGAGSIQPAPNFATLVQLLATEGIKLPPSVVQKAIDSYIIHTDTGSRRIDPPTREKRIAALFRGSAPRGIEEQKYEEFCLTPFSDPFRIMGSGRKTGRLTGKSGLSPKTPKTQKHCICIYE
jgi:hypothetical protein